MNYYILTYRPIAESIIIQDYRCNVEEIADKLSSGEKIKSQIQYLELVPDSKVSIKNDLIDTMVFTVSEALKNSILGISKNIESIKVKIDDNEDNYYAINILSVIDSLDRERSVYTTNRSGKIIRRIDKVILKPSLINDLHIFRDKNFSSRIIVSEKAKKSFEEFSGVSFIKISEFKKEF